MPRHKDKSGFQAFDAPLRSDVGLSPRHGDRILRESCDHLPLFASSVRPDVPRQRRAGRPRLSLGHIDSTSDNQPLTPEAKPIKPPRIAVWGKGSRADFPGISDLNPKPRHSTPPRRSPRGKVLTFSECSRRTLQRLLATVDRHAPAFTSCLSCPGDWSPDRNARAKAVFLLLLKQATSSRDQRIRSVGLLWKQELQSREAVHFHLLLWGVTSESRAFVHQWFATRWNALVAAHSDADGRARHLAVHLHESNFQEVRNMAGYFAKYLGKDAEAVLTGSPIPGRWWGRINSDRIPFATASIVENPPPRFRVICHRIARKLRQKRADEAKHRALCRAAGFVDDQGNPHVSQFFMTCARHFRSIHQPHSITHHEVARFHGLRFGRYRFPGPLKTGSVVLVGEFAPATAKRLLEYAVGAFRDYLERVPF